MWVVRLSRPLIAPMRGVVHDVIAERVVVVRRSGRGLEETFAAEQAPLRAAPEGRTPFLTFSGRSPLRRIALGKNDGVAAENLQLSSAIPQKLRSIDVVRRGQMGVSCEQNGHNFRPGQMLRFPTFGLTH